MIDENESHLAQHGCVAVASSAVVDEHLRDVGFAPLLWENVADTDVFAGAARDAPGRTPNSAFFAGNLSPLKVDYGLLASLAKTGVRVRVAGPRAEGGGHDSDQFRTLVDAGVEYLGTLPLERVAEEMGSATVGLIPYRMNEYTRGVSPLKTYEYLASGLAVVSTDLPGVSHDGVDVWRTRSTDEFVARVQRFRAAPSVEEVDRRLETALRHSWGARGRQIRAMLAEQLETLGAAPCNAEQPEREV
ncbi:glycosyltransferase [Microbacterium aquimaris]|uniref:glycosyltransferase n=1 Tax=Microbacterium aquimaris TaxID=459816 RepID=UPI002AD5B24A|nr:glycosyltransferase [Microbacterium aquimaris]MDZ8274819.1 glycosyltransferase [Microbacterium aquimaris]